MLLKTTIKTPMQLIKFIKDKISRVDFVLLIFLLLMSQEKIVLKLLALLFIFAFHFNVKFGFKADRLPLFYLLVVFVEIMKYLFMGNSYLGNLSTLGVSSLYWLLSFLTLHQLMLSAEGNRINKTENALKVFTWINLLVCLFQLVRIMIVTRSLNPYSVEIFAPDIRFPEIIFPYGHSSGDLIRGVFYDNHYNAIVSQFCLIFFLSGRKYLAAFLNLFIITIICFNLVTLITMFVLFYYFLILKGLKPKLLTAGGAGFVIIFYIFITPENISYLTERIENTFSSVTKNTEGLITRKTRVNNNAYADSMNRKYKNYSLQGDSAKQTLLIDSTYNIDKVSGKKIAYSQTFKFLNEHKQYAIFGCGAGMFSSKLANNFSGVFAKSTLLNRNLPSPDYSVYHKNHGSLNKFLSNQVIGKHSINNFPNSVYNQLLTEYGIFGVLLFVIFYLLFFIKKYKRLSFGFLLIPLILIYFNYGYYFETLDIVIFFELLMFLDLSRTVRLKSE